MSKTEQKTVRHRLFEPVDIGILVYFRIIFGAIMLWQVFRFFQTDSISKHYIEPTFHFTYYGFDWVQPWPGDGMYVHFVVLAILSVCIILGFKYRITTALFFVGFTYLFLLEETRYQNHFYLIILISFLMIFVPANRKLSIDAWRNHKIKSDDAPAWSLWILRFQLGVVYFYGGLAKLNWDWLNGDPMRIWLAQRTGIPLIGGFLTEEWMVFFFAYGALLLDLFAVPFLLWRRTRLFAFGILVAFHVLNSQLFSIGIFPWFMIFATVLFFDPSWRRFNIWKRSKEPSPRHRQHITNLTKNQKIILALLLIFVLVQLSVPLRHFAYPGNVAWTLEGNYFSWHMMLNDRIPMGSQFYSTDPATGKTWGTGSQFYATDPATGKTWKVQTSEDLDLFQWYIMFLQPDLILEYSHYLADRLNQEEGYEDIEIRVVSMISLNGREFQLNIDPTVNLAEQPQTLLPKTWILPLKEK